MGSAAVRSRNASFDSSLASSWLWASFRAAGNGTAWAAADTDR